MKTSSAFVMTRSETVSFDRGATADIVAVVALLPGVVEVYGNDGIVRHSLLNGVSQRIVARGFLAAGQIRFNRRNEK